jgi:hypothetical protein
MSYNFHCYTPAKEEVKKSSQNAKYANEDKFTQIFKLLLFSALTKLLVREDLRYLRSKKTFGHPL